MPGPMNRPDGRTAYLRQACAYVANDLSLEALWQMAAAVTLLSGRLVDPPIVHLRAGTLPDRVWDIAPWPAEVQHARVSCLYDCVYLALATRDEPWLEQLARSWEHPGIQEIWQRLARGLVGFGLHPRRYAWTADDLERFELAGSLPQSLPEDRSWLALSRGDLPAARAALYDCRIAAGERARKEAAAQTDAELDALLSWPGEVLRVELRALEALIDG